MYILIRIPNIYKIKQFKGLMIDLSGRTKNILKKYLII